MVLSFKIYVPVWFAALALAALLTPKVTLAVRILGFLIAGGLTSLIWGAVIYCVGTVYDDGDTGL